MTERRIPGYCPLCISRCGCTNVVERGRLLRVEPDPEHPTGATLCMKGRNAPALVNHPGRLRHPLMRTRPKGDADPGWRPITWEEALERTAAAMEASAEDGGPESVAFSLATPSGTALADGLPWLFRLANAFGTPNTVWTSHICNWHRDFTPQLTFGAGIGVPDYARSGCILLWGFDPAVSWPAQATRIAKAKRRGARLVVVDPRRAGLAAQADQWLRLRPGTDGALALAVAAVMIDAGWYDAGFLRRWSNAPFLVREDDGRLLDGSEVEAMPKGPLVWDEPAGEVRPAGAGSLHAALDGLVTVTTVDGPVTCRPVLGHYAKSCRAWTPERAEAETGVAAAQIVDTARLLHEHRPVSFYMWAGVAQGANVSQSSRAITWLYALTGDLDAPGGNVWFPRPPLNDVAGGELLPEAQRAKTLGLGARPLGPASKGWITTADLYRAVLEGEPYPVRTLVAFGSNPLLTRPDPAQGEKALSALRFYAQADLFLTQSARYADVVLPVSSPWEREGLAAGFGVDEEAEAWLQLRAPVVEPLGQSRSDEWIAFELAQRLGLGGTFFDGDREAGLAHRLAPTGLSPETLRASPRGTRAAPAPHYRTYVEAGFATPSGRIELYSERLVAAGQPPVPVYRPPDCGRPDFPLRLTSAKWPQFCHSQMRQVEPLRRRMPEPLAEVHPETAARRGIGDGDAIAVRTSRGTAYARARFNRDLDPSVVCMQYGWQEDGAGRPANYAALVGNEVRDPVSGSFPLRERACQIDPAQGERVGMRRRPCRR